MIRISLLYIQDHNENKKRHRQAEYSVDSTTPKKVQ